MPEFQDFCKRWHEKANAYGTDNLQECFDKFFTLFVVYNALYVAAAGYLHRKASEEKRDDYKLEGDSFPDKAAATKYVLDILKSRNLLNALESNSETSRALKQLIKIMEEDAYNIVLEPVWGKPRKQEDNKLLGMLKSSSSDEKARAILQIIYEVRCNLVHGRKNMHPTQENLLRPIVVILEKVVELLYRKLQNMPFIFDPTF